MTSGPDPERFEGKRKITTTMGHEIEVEWPEFLDLHRQGLIKTDSKTSKREGA